MEHGFAARLRRWFSRHARNLPWRRTRDPYRIWVSEIMLQQTRAAAVIPYFQTFLKRFPDVRALARAGEAELLECWSGLGYYSRARNLYRAAKWVVSHPGGKLPETYDRWLELPGVGPYTAAAIASVSFGAPVAVLDGNVARVMARVTNHRGDVRSPKVREDLRLRAQKLLDRRHPGDFNQAMMELGATVCLPRRPRCTECPVEPWCEARRLGVENELPIKLRERKPVRLWIAVAIVSRHGRILMRRRPENLSLLPGFWELPQSNGPDLDSRCLGPPRLGPGEPLGRFRHSITYHEYTVTVFPAALRGRPPAGYEWVGAGRRRGLPLTTVARKALRLWDQSRGITETA